MVDHLKNPEFFTSSQSLIIGYLVRNLIPASCNAQNIGPLLSNSSSGRSSVAYTNVRLHLLYTSEWDRAEYRFDLIEFCWVNPDGDFRPIEH